MLVRVCCPNPECGKRYQVEESQLGRATVCKHCGREFVVQKADRETPSQTAESETLQYSAPAPVGDIPERIGRFDIRARLGAGSFGTVYRAHDPVLDREVALKVPRAAVLEKPEARARFLREPKAAARLRHPHIVPVFDAGTDGDRYYIASAYIDGRTLEELIERDRLDFRRAAQIVRDLAGALDYAHRIGVIHRDVKPANIMIDVGGDSLLMDFGLARLEESEEKLTQDGSVMGTPAYMAPEQASREFGEVGPAADQYSLGVVLYELLCGQTPFSGPPAVVIFNALHQTPDPPRRANPTIPRDLETICQKAIGKSPQDRYADCGTLAEDLRRWLADEPILARRMGWIEQTVRWVRRNPMPAALISAVVLVTAIGLAAVSWQWRRAEGNLAEADRQRQLAERKQEQAETERKRAEAEKNRAVKNSYCLTVAIASYQCQASHCVLAKNLLDECPSNLRHWEWGHLKRQLRSHLHTLRPNMHAVVNVAFSPDCRRMAWGSYTGWKDPVRVWDTETNREVHALRGHTSGVICVAFSADGKRLASGSGDRTVKLWDVQSGQEVQTLQGHASAVECVAFSPDGKRLVPQITVVSPPKPRLPHLRGGLPSFPSRLWGFPSRLWGFPSRLWGVLPFRR